MLQAPSPCLSFAPSGFSCVPALQCGGAGVARGPGTNQLEGTFDSLGVALLDIRKRDVSGMWDPR